VKEPTSITPDEDRLYENYLMECEKIVNTENIFSEEPERFTKEEFVSKLLTEDNFYEKWGDNSCEELTYIERYNKWIGNNFETGMEYHPEIVPDFDNDYYDPTPKRKLKNEKK